LKAALSSSSSYLPPVFITLTAAESELSGMPRPKSRTVTSPSETVMSIWWPKPFMYSSIELSTTSLMRT